MGQNESACTTMAGRIKGKWTINLFIFSKTQTLVSLIFPFVFFLVSISFISVLIIVTIFFLLTFIIFLLFSSRVMPLWSKKILGIVSVFLNLLITGIIWLPFFFCIYHRFLLCVYHEVNIIKPFYKYNCLFYADNFDYIQKLNL